MRFNPLKSVRALCLAPIIVLGLVSAAQAQTAKPAMRAASMPSASMPMQKSAASAGDMMQAMMKGTDRMQKMSMSGDTDKDFAMMMKLHHQQALDMAQMELEQGKSSEMKKMAKSIISAQKKEIAQFDKWLAKQK